MSTPINTAFITGAASGIGKATAERLYQQGWTLGLADMNTDALLELIQDWDQQRITHYSLDVTDAEQAHTHISHFSEKNDKKLKVLFNCAGILSIDYFQNIPAERHQLIMDINVNGVMNCSLAAYPYLKNTNDAVVINMSSASALYGVPMLASYSASKFAVSGLTEALNIEWEDDGIRVCDIMPALVNTNMLTEQELPPVMQKMGTKMSTNDVVNVVLKNIHKPKVHSPVGSRFKLQYSLSHISPRPVIGAVMRLLHRL